MTTVKSKYSKQQLKQKIFKIFPGTDIVSFGNVIEIEEDTGLSSAVTFDKLSQLSEAFKTKDINLRGWSRTGCETCGPDYGVTIVVKLKD